MTGVAEYDHIDPKLTAKNFVAHARVEGQENLHGTQWALLADSILNDLSKENLGGNSVLRLPLSTYKYLRVTIDGPVKPADIWRKLRVSSGTESGVARCGRSANSGGDANERGAQ